MNPALRPYVESVATGERPEQQLVERAQHLLDQEDAHRRRRLAKSRPRRQAEAAVEEIQACEMAALRAQVVARAAGRGELCGRPLRAEEGELCHLDGGSGKRRQLQRPENCVFEHHNCHQGPLGFDAKPLAWLPEVRAWADRNDYPVPERFRKLDALAPVRALSAGRSSP